MGDTAAGQAVGATNQGGRQRGAARKLGGAVGGEAPQDGGAGRHGRAGRHRSAGLHVPGDEDWAEEQARAGGDTAAGTEKDGADPARDRKDTGPEQRTDEQVYVNCGGGRDRVLREEHAAEHGGL